MYVYALPPYLFLDNFLIKATFKPFICSANVNGWRNKGVGGEFKITF